jgi:hypothetical protein
MKKGGSCRPRYQHPHVPMNDTTRAFLRNAVFEALNAKADGAAMELLSILTDSPIYSAAPAVQIALPPAREVVDGPPHDYHYWVRFIREHFIPFITGNGRVKFTSHELMTWLENCNSLQLTSGDLNEPPSGGVTWRNVVSDALSALKQQGAIVAPVKSKEYSICSPVLLQSSLTT